MSLKRKFTSVFSRSIIFQPTCIYMDVGVVQYLAVEGDKMKYDLTRAAVEARQCQDLLSQVFFNNILPICFYLYIYLPIYFLILRDSFIITLSLFIFLLIFFFVFSPYFLFLVFLLFLIFPFFPFFPYFSSFSLFPFSLYSFYYFSLLSLFSCFS